MAVIRREYNINAFWNSDEVLDALQTALADVGYHAPAQTGTILTFTNTAGTAIASQKGRRYLVKQSATSGSGRYSTFDILRNTTTGAVSAVTLVNGGENYAAANTITIAGADIGGVTPTDNLTITVSTVSGSQGSATTWYDKDTAVPYTWGVCCVNQDATKKMGQTYYSFQLSSNPGYNPTLYIKSGVGFQSNTNVFTGVAALDHINNGPNTTSAFALTIARTNTTPLRLVTFQSSIDPNFVVFQFSDVQMYGDVYRDPFFLSKYSTATQPWSLDDCYTGGVYLIGKAMASNTADANIFVRLSGETLGRRAGEWGYYGNIGSGARPVIGYYESIFGRRLLGGSTAITTQYPAIYQRTSLDLIHEMPDYTPIITGLPICNVMVPVPYYIPSDFGITEVIGTNVISHGDLLSVGSTTKWRVLQYGNNQNAQTYNTSIAFVCKMVD